MTVLARFPSHTEKSQDTHRPRAAAIPVTFSGTVGLYHPADPARTLAPAAALFVSPWGYEELCVRKTWRVLAEELAGIGIASLRFDYSNTGDALDRAEEGLSLDSWRALIGEAAAQLKALSGVEKIILIGHGLGAALAAQAAGGITGVEGFAALAPVTSGRSYLRELSVWSMITEGRKHVSSDTGFTVGGLTLPRGVHDDIRDLKLLHNPGLPAPACFVAARADRPGDAELASTLQTAGGRVETVEYEGYDQLVGRLTFSRTPMAVIERLTAWARSLAGRLPQCSVMPPPLPAAQPLSSEGFTETPFRFGENNRLYGILCEPADGVRKGAMVLMLTTAYERMSGWGRVAAITARQLAQAGIPSLRFDAANAADSPPLPGAPEQISYSDAQYHDVEEALDYLEDWKLGHIVVAGRCSGAYLAFRMLARDKRLRGAVAFNPYVFHWDSSQSLEELLLFVPKELTSYGGKLLRRDTWQRIANGQINLKYAIINTTKSLGKRGLRMAGPLLEALPALSRERREVHHAFQAIENHKARLSLVYSADDPGLEHFRLHFGADGKKLQRYPHARHQVVADADHDMTTEMARDTYRNEIMAIALANPPGRG